MKRLIVIGAGLHFRKKYLPVLSDCSIALVIDLESQKARIIERVAAERYLFLPESMRDCVEVETVDRLIGKVTADAVLICTEPSVRTPFALWATKRGYPLFLDKPATTTLSDFERLLKVGAHGVISCERRANLGYKRVFEEIDRCGLPLTSIDIHFAGGIWKSPQEYLYEPNHPFFKGYGMLLHSGYHYIDLLCRLLNYCAGDTLEIEAIGATPSDYMACVGKGEYEKLGVEEKVHKAQFWESDVAVYGRKKDAKITTALFSAKMIGTSLSMRSSLERGEQLPGKVRQEHLLLHFGHLMTLRLDSVQYHRIDRARVFDEQFNLTILRNPLIPGAPIQRFSREHIAAEGSLNTRARQYQLREFLAGRDGHSSIQSHLSTMQMLQKIEEALQCKRLCGV